MIWEEWQLDMLRETYPDHGGTPVAKATGRKRTAVQKKARKLGLEKRTPAGSKYDYSGIEEQLKRIYAKRSLGALKKLSERCGIPIGSLKYRARIHLRLPPMIVVDRHKRPWEDREIDILEAYGERLYCAHRTDVDIADPARLANHLAQLGDRPMGHCTLPSFATHEKIPFLSEHPMPCTGCLCVPASQESQS